MCYESVAAEYLRLHLGHAMLYGYAKSKLWEIQKKIMCSLKRVCQSCMFQPQAILKYSNRAILYSNSHLQLQQNDLHF